MADEEPLSKHFAPFAQSVLLRELHAQRLKVDAMPSPPPSSRNYRGARDSTGLSYSPPMLDLYRRPEPTYHYPHLYGRSITMEPEQRNVITDEQMKMYRDLMSATAAQLERMPVPEQQAEDGDDLSEEMPVMDGSLTLEDPTL